MPASEEVVIRSATAADSDALVTVIREGFDAELQRMMIYGASGMAEFVRDTLRLPRALNDRVYTVAEDSGGCIIGAVELRRLSDALVLNYIAVSEQYRARGLANRLLYEAILQAGGPRWPRMVLDVLAANQKARGWYDRLGFEPEFETDWWAVLPRGLGTPCSSAQVGGFAPAEAAQHRYGFSQFDVRTARESYSVGRMGELWFRVTQPGALVDQDLLATLAELDPGRRLLALLREGALPAGVMGEVRLMASTTRMQVPLGSLLDCLADRGAPAGPFHQRL